MRAGARGRMIVDMTLHEHIEQNSFAYCDELPPDVAEGLPLTAARRDRPRSQPALKRALRHCRRALARRR